MAISTNPYLCIADGKCREAMTFYGEIFGVEPQILPLSGMTDMPDDPDQVMHAELRRGDFVLMAADNVGQQDLKHGNTVEIAIMGEAEDREFLTTAFQGLAEGGQVIMPLERQEWGALYGQLLDRYGFEWAINIHLEPSRA